MLLLFVIFIFDEKKIKNIRWKGAGLDEVGLDKYNVLQNRDHHDSSLKKQK